MSKTVRLSFSLNAVDDAELIRVLSEKQERGEGSSFIRAALYAYIEGPSRAELMASMHSLEGRVNALFRRLGDRVNAVEEPEGEAEANILSKVREWRGVSPSGETGGLSETRES